MVKMIDIDKFDEESRVWVYQSDRKISQDEIEVIQRELNQFVNKWTAHNLALKSHGWVSEHMFLFLMVDESQAGASGCSIDKSVAFIESLGEKLNINWFDRLTFTYKDKNGDIHRISKDDLRRGVDENIIDDNTLFFNTLIQKKKDLAKDWTVPFKSSWQKRFL